MDMGKNVPIIKNLTTENMATYAPTIRPSFASKPVVAKGLGVKVVHLVTGMVDVNRCLFGTSGEKYTLRAQGCVLAFHSSNLTFEAVVGVRKGSFCGGFDHPHIHT